MTNTEITNQLNIYKSSYENKYWNAGIDESSLSKTNWGTTNSTSTTNNTFGNATQCYGYSLFIAYVLSNYRLNYAMVEYAQNNSVIANGWVVYKSNLSSLTLEPGDIIRTGTSGQEGHSAVVWQVFNDGTFKVTECLGSESSILKWGYFNKNIDTNQHYVSTILSEARYILKAPKTYKIKNAGSGKYLTVMDSSATDGGRVVQLTSQSTDRQKWVTFSAEGTGHIVSELNSGYAIKYAPNDDSYCKIHTISSTESGAITTVSSGSYFKIKTIKSGTTYYLAADASGSNVYWTSGDSTAYQKWTFTQVN